MNKYLTPFIILLSSFSLSSIADTMTESENIVAQEVKYTIDEKEHIGYIAYDSNINKPLPGVIVVHEWKGINDYARKRAVDLAKEGYVGFAIDMYGEGLEVKTNSQVRTLSRSVGTNFDLIEKRFNAALDVLKTYQQVDENNLAAIGYCFGGGIVLNMARLGTEINGVVSYHGSFNTGLDATTDSIKTKILAFQGDADPIAPQEVMNAFSEEMEKANADFEFIIYDDVVAHNFTNPAGQTYHEDEANLAWIKMLEFFNTVFK